MAESYEEYLERMGPSIKGMPAGMDDKGKTTMTVPSNADYRRTQWGNQLSNEDLNSLITGVANNRLDLNPVFDPANPVTSQVVTQKDNDGNSVTKTYKGTYDSFQAGDKEEDAKIHEAASVGEQIKNAWSNGVSSFGASVVDRYSPVINSVTEGVGSAEEFLTDVYTGVNNAGSDLGDSIADGYDSSMNRLGVASDNIVDGYKAVTSFPGDVWDDYGAGSGYFAGKYDNAIDSISTAASERYSPFIDSIASGYNRLMSGKEIPVDEAGSDANIAAAQEKVNEAITRVENLTGMSYSVPSTDKIHPIDAHPLVVAATKDLNLQFNAKERFESGDVINVEKVLNAISETDTWDRVEQIANSLEQKGYKAGDNITEWAAENPWTALATVFYGGPATAMALKAPFQLATYLIKKSPSLIKRGFTWLASGNGIVLTGLGIEQYFKNEKEVDAWLDEYVPEVILNPIDALASVLTDTEKPDVEIVDDMEIIQTSAQINSSDDTDVAILDSTEVPANKAVVDTVNPNQSTQETAAEPSVFETVTPSQLAAPEVAELLDNAGVENLSPTTDEAAVVLAKTPVLIDRMNSLADYMDSTTDEEALAAARQTAIEIENDPSHSDLTSAAAMTFIASMMFGGNMTDSFNAAFKPVGNYYEAKKAAAIKRKDEAVAEQTRINLENRASKLEQKKYNRNLKDSKEAAAVTAAARVGEFNATQQQSADQFNIGERNDLLIAGVKAEKDVAKAYIKAKEVEKNRILTARKDFLKYAQGIPTDDLKNILLKRKLPSFDGQLVEALTQMKGIFNKRKNEYGDPLEFDMSVLENKSAVIAAIENYTKDVANGTSFRRNLSSYVTDMIIKRELVGVGLEQVIKPNFFQVPDEGDSMLKFKDPDNDLDDSLYVYKKQSKRKTLGKTDFAFAETTAKIHDFITNVAFSEKTADGNILGMTKAVQLFGKDYTDAQTNDPVYFDRVVRAAVKEGVHPFTYFIVQHMGMKNPGKLGSRFLAK